MKWIKYGIIAFLIIGSIMIITQNDYDVKDSDGQKSFIKSFGSWIWNIGKNTKDVTTYAVKEHDWLPKNNTNSTD